MHFVTLPWWSLNWCMSETQFKVIVDAHWSGSSISKSLPSPMFIKIQLSLRPNQRAKLRSSKKLSHQRLPVDKVADRHTHCCSSIAVWFWFSAHSPSHIIKHSDNSQIQIYIYDTNICVNNSAPHSPFSGIIIVIVLPLTLRLTLYISRESWFRPLQEQGTSQQQPFQLCPCCGPTTSKWWSRDWCSIATGPTSGSQELVNVISGIQSEFKVHSHSLLLSINFKWMLNQRNWSTGHWYYQFWFRFMYSLLCLTLLSLCYAPNAIHAKEVYAWM